MANEIVERKSSGHILSTRPRVGYLSDPFPLGFSAEVFMNVSYLPHLLYSCPSLLLQFANQNNRHLLSSSSREASRYSIPPGSYYLLPLRPKYEEVLDVEYKCLVVTVKTTNACTYVSVNIFVNRGSCVYVCHICGIFSVLECQYESYFVKVFTYCKI